MWAENNYFMDDKMYKLQDCPGGFSSVLPDWVGVNNTAEHGLLLLINYHVRCEADHPETTTTTS